MQRVLVENRDFVLLPQKGEQRGRGGHNRSAYHLTVDAAKHIAMMSGTDKGFQVREYFIECERRAQAAAVAPGSHTLGELLRLQARQDGKIVRLGFTSVIKEFVDYATAQGSKNAEKYYMQLTKMENKALFIVGSAVGDGFRDKLTAIQNIHLATAEDVARRALRDGMDRQLPYREIYQLAKQRVEIMAGLVGKSEPGRGDFGIATAA